MQKRLAAVVTQLARSSVNFERAKANDRTSWRVFFQVAFTPTDSCESSTATISLQPAFGFWECRT
jgi:hypothetical protein